MLQLLKPKLYPQVVYSFANFSSTEEISCQIIPQIMSAEWEEPNNFSNYEYAVIGTNKTNDDNV